MSLYNRQYNFSMNKRLFWLMAVTCFLLTMSFAPNSSGSARTVERLPASNAYDLIDAVNALRAAHGLYAYNPNSILMNIAQAQANYLLSTGGAYGHIGPGGSSPYQRALAAGYPVANALTNPPGFFSENWMSGSSGSAQGAVEAWQGDYAHLHTMLSTDLRDIGAGIATDGSMYYFVIDCGLASGSVVNPPAGGTLIMVSGTPATQDNRIMAAIVSTPDANGKIYHVVQPGQTLWQIALAYKTTINEIKRLNGLQSVDIYMGQKLLIGQAGTPTPIPPTITPTRDLSTSTPMPTLVIFTETATGTQTPLPVAPVSGSAGSVAVIAIVIVALIAAGFVAWAGRSRPV